VIDVTDGADVDVNLEHERTPEMRNALLGSMPRRARRALKGDYELSHAFSVATRACA
jgi:hypothetical protein